MFKVILKYCLIVMMTMTFISPSTSNAWGRKDCEDCKEEYEECSDAVMDDLKTCVADVVQNEFKDCFNSAKDSCIQDDKCGVGDYFGPSDDCASCVRDRALKCIGLMNLIRNSAFQNCLAAGGQQASACISQNDQCKEKHCYK